MPPSALDRNTPTDELRQYPGIRVGEREGLRLRHGDTPMAPMTGLSPSQNRPGPGSDSGNLRPGSKQTNYRSWLKGSEPFPGPGGPKTDHFYLARTRECLNIRRFTLYNVLVLIDFKTQVSYHIHSQTHIFCFYVLVEKTCCRFSKSLAILFRMHSWWECKHKQLF